MIDAFDKQNLQLLAENFAPDVEVHLPTLGVLKGLKDLSEYFLYMFRGTTSDYLIKSAHFTQGQVILVVDANYVFTTGFSLCCPWISTFGKDALDTKIQRLQLFGEIGQFLDHLKLPENSGGLPVHLFNTPVSDTSNA